MSESTTVDRDLLLRRFGHDALRAHQGAVIDRVMHGGDALAVMPTGSGKSLCYQYPALALRERRGGTGLTLVFSPLIALMEDQVSALRARDIRATYLNSTLRKAERERRMAKMAEGAYELVYATPERMERPGFTEALAAVPGGVHLLAVDEAHCIAKWGHDLRPAYRRVGAWREHLGAPPTIALTATATRAVREEIREVLGRDADAMPLFAMPVARPNLALAAESIWDDGDRLRIIGATADAHRGTGIVYFALIRDLERFADVLRRERPDLTVMLYHGQLDPREKKAVYDAFIEARPDDRLVLLATNAFGMGVDKPDIRFIVHAQLPGSIEAYAQEVGRAGRDGAPSACVLLYAEDDLAVQQTFVEWKNPDVALLRQAAETALDRPEADFDADELHQDVLGRRRGDRRMEYVLTALSDLGVFEPTAIPGRYRALRALEAGEVNPDEVTERRTRDLTRLLEMVKLTRSADIPAAISAYFEL